MKTTLRSKLINKPQAVLAWMQLLLALLFAPLAFAEDNQNQPAQPAFSQQELDQMLAPIALYPDALLSQVLMASTYPLEVVQAARWSRAHPDLKGDDAVKAVEKNNWDPSVISLVAFPQVLAQMDDKLDWTERLGDAFLDQQDQVMDTVQKLRQKAREAGNLQSNDQIRVVPQEQTIVIEQAAPEIIYVPYYNPTVVYGPWWWDAYPPVYWAPWPGYYYRPGFSATFFWGSGISISGGFFFSDFDWHRRQVNVVNVHNYYYTNYYANPRHSNPYNRDWDGRNRSGNAGNPAPDNNSPHEWRHDPGHRHGVPYNDPALQQRFGQANDARTNRNFQGHGQPARGTATQPTDRPTAPGNRPGTDTQSRHQHEQQINNREPNPAAAGASGNSNRRLDRRDKSDTQLNATPDNQPDSSKPDNKGGGAANPNKVDRSNRQNRPDNNRGEIRSNAPSTTPGNVPESRPVTPQAPVIRAPEPAGHAGANESRGGWQAPENRNGGGTQERAAPAQQRPENNAEKAHQNERPQPKKNHQEEQPSK